ncbi:MAG: hypothetical protein Fur005_33070 [Roseiflexaceae bacterium]
MMRTEYPLGVVLGLRLSTTPVVFLGSILLWVIFAGVGVGLLGLPIGMAIIAALVAVALHWLSEIGHQYGHAWVAQRVGYPMLGIRLGTLWVLSTSIYPANEPTLPAAIHIRRALGGPIASLLLSLIGGVLVLALQPLGQPFVIVGLFFALENLLVFAIGSLIPLGFNDGSTLLYWWDKR